VNPPKIRSHPITYLMIYPPGKHIWKILVCRFDSSVFLSPDISESRL